MRKNKIKQNKIIKNNFFILNKLNKKGISFFALVVPMVLVFTFILFLTHINNNNEVSKDLEFGSTLKDLDKIYTKIPAETFFRDMLYDTALKDLKKDFVKNYYSNLKNNLIEYDENNLEGCSYNGLNLWFNDNYKIGSEDLIKIKTSLGLDENSNLEKSFLKNSKINICLPNFDYDLSEDFKQEISDSIDSSLQKNIEIQNLDNTNIEIGYTNLNKYLINISSIYTENKNIGKIKVPLNYNFEYELGEFPLLLKVIEKTLPEIKKTFKTEIPKCIKENMNKELQDNVELFCYNKIFLKTIEKTNDGKKILTRYKFKLENIENLLNQKYFGLKITITNKKTKKEELVFGIILEDNIPYSLVNFKLKNSEKYDNVVDVIIEKPKFRLSEGDKYVILYSYNDFFKNLKLKEILNKRLLNENFDKGIGQEKIANIENTRHSIPTNLNGNLDVEMLLVSKGNFIDNKKIVNIYQKYNQKTGEFELLKNQNLFVYVFVVDKNNNFYIDGFEERDEIFILPLMTIPPKPLKKENLIVSGNLENKEQSIEITVKNYNDNKFNNYDIYVFSGRGSSLIKDKCIGANYNCYYFDGSNSLRNKDLNIILTNSGILSGSNIIFSNQFTNNLVIKNSEEYEIFIAVKDKKGNQVLKKIQTYESPKKVSENFYGFSTNKPMNLFIPEISKITVQNNLPIIVE